MKIQKTTHLILALIASFCAQVVVSAETPLFNPKSYYTISCTYQGTVYYLKASLYPGTKTYSGAIYQVKVTPSHLDSSFMWRITEGPGEKYKGDYLISSLLSVFQSTLSYDGDSVNLKFTYNLSPTQLWSFTSRGKETYNIAARRSAGSSWVMTYSTITSYPKVKGYNKTLESQIWTITEVAISKTEVCNITSNAALISSTLVGGYNSLKFVDQGVKYIADNSTADTITRSMGTKFSSSFNAPLSDLKANTHYSYYTYYNWEKGVSLISSPQRFKTAVTPAPAPAWGYANTNWVCGGYTECGGPIQSPIGLNDASAPTAVLPDFTTHYKSFSASLYDNGHSLYVNDTIDAISNSVTFNNKTYYFKQMHFHTPSEHAVNDSFTPMEVHIVHQDLETNSLLVVGILLNNKGSESAQANRLMEDIYKAWPGGSQEVHPTEVYTQFAGVVNRSTKTTVNVNMNDLLPAPSKLFMYTGSLTTPPCWQGVTFLVYQSPLTISASVCSNYAAKFHGNNARPIQPLNNRILILSK